MTHRPLTPRERSRAFRATHASQHLTPRVRKPYVAVAAVSTADARFADVETYLRETRAADTVCRCGTYVCSQRVPCAPPSAPVAEAPKAKAAHAFVVGDRCRVVSADISDLREAIVGRGAVIVAVHGNNEPTRYAYRARVDKVGDPDPWAQTWDFRAGDLEPAAPAPDARLEPLPAADLQAGEWTPESVGFKRCSDTTPGPDNYAYGTSIWYSDPRPARVEYGEHTGWRAVVAGERASFTTHASGALACCAALAIRLEDNGFICWATDAAGECLANGGNGGGRKTEGERREYIARAALLAHASRGAR